MDVQSECLPCQKPFCKNVYFMPTMINRVHLKHHYACKWLWANNKKLKISCAIIVEHC